MLIAFFLSFLAFWVLRRRSRRSKQMKPCTARFHELVDIASHFLVIAVEALEVRLREVYGFAKRFLWPKPVGVSAMTVLPPEINSEVARFLGLVDLAALSACATSTWQNIRDSAEVWGALANDRNLDVVSSWTSDPREAFRCEFFRTDGQQLLRLSSEMRGVGGAWCAVVLTEAAHVARGLMPSDGRQAWAATCRTAERALEAHNPANEEHAAAAKGFLQVVFKRRQLAGVANVKRVEDAYNNALKLHASIDVAMDEKLSDLESDDLEVSTNATMDELASGLLSESESD